MNDRIAQIIEIILMVLKWGVWTLWAIAIIAMFPTFIQSLNGDDDDEAEFPATCSGCSHLVGDMVDGKPFVCALHPDGLENCPDYRV